jgi:preprotein translocase subunit SecD
MVRKARLLLVLLSAGIPTGVSALQRRPVRLDPALAKPDRPEKKPAPTGFSTEFRFGIDRTRAEARKLGRADERKLEQVLRRRLPIFAANGGEVEVRSLDEILVRAPIEEKVADGQIRMFVRPGVLEVRKLDDLQTSLNGDGRYNIEYREVQGVSSVRFRDRQKARAIPANEFLPRCPLLADNTDIVRDGVKVVGETALFVRVALTQRAAERLAAFHRKVGRLMALSLDGELVGILGSAPELLPNKKERPAGPGLDTLDLAAGFSTADEAGYLAEVLNAGPLEVPLRLLSTRLIAR